MSNSEVENTPTYKRFQFNLIPIFLLHPKSVFSKLDNLPRGSWLTPILIISLSAILYIIATGWIKQQAALTGNIDLPPDFDYYTAEQQTQFLQASQATQSPTFLYILPVTGSLLGIWLGWLLVGGVLHLSTTLFGGRGGTAQSINLVAWASLPFAIRNIIRLIYMVANHRLIESPGLSGFILNPETNWLILLSAILSLIDIYIIWHIILLILGVKITAGLSTGKSIASVLITILFTTGLQAGAQFLIAKLGNLSITRPFFF